MRISLMVIMLLALCMSAPLFAGGQQDAGNTEVTQPSIPDLISVELIYLNHGPVRRVLIEIDNLLEGYGKLIQVTRYDFNTTEGEAFAEASGLKEHTPLAIFVDGSMEFTVDYRPVKFLNFPQGQGTGVVPDGAWSIDDLREVLDQVLKKN